ncbi:hypothetical protein Aca07nite_46300 [Actinoplanes capillaceus]|uniref:Uncharacterized protein n=1 Tax=Actinoplanes campanulatus TaxID=113559 RepID=A0ABQ3WMC8_9ACTN|nr:hypothetical protein Aca07nite_46300 [Actinoplanes capillaceus]
MWQGAEQGGRVDPTVRSGEGRPAHPVHLLPAEHQVEAAAERVGVDQQGAVAGPDRGGGQPGGEDARPGAAAAADHREGPRGGGRSGESRELVDHPGVGLRQNRQVVGADEVGHREGRLHRLRVADQDEPGPPGQPGPEAGGHLVGADQHHRGTGPAGPGGGRVGRHLDLASAGRGEAQQVVEQVLVGGHDEGAARSGHRVSSGDGGVGRPPSPSPYGRDNHHQPRLWITTDPVDNRYARR